MSIAKILKRIILKKHIPSSFKKPQAPRTVIGRAPEPDAQKIKDSEAVSNFRKNWGWLAGSSTKKDVNPAEARAYETERRNLPASVLTNRDHFPHITQVARVKRDAPVPPPTLNYKEINAPKNQEDIAPAIDYKTMNAPKNQEATAPTLNYKKINSPKIPETKTPTIDYSKFK